MPIIHQVAAEAKQTSGKPATGELLIHGQDSIWDMDKNEPI